MKYRKENLNSKEGFITKSPASFHSVIIIGNYSAETKNQVELVAPNINHGPHALPHPLVNKANMKPMKKAKLFYPGLFLCV